MTKPPFRAVFLYRTHLERFEALGMHDKRLSWRSHVARERRGGEGGNLTSPASRERRGPTKGPSPSRELSSATVETSRFPNPPRSNPTHPNHMKIRWVKSHRIFMAEREGFEPSVTLRLHQISSLAHSTTLTPLHILGEASVINSCRVFAGARFLARSGIWPKPTLATLHAPCH